MSDAPSAAEAEAARSLRRLPAAHPRGAPITIELDGELVRAYAGEPVAVALWAEGVRLIARSPKYHRPRGLFCGNGHCGSCPLRIDGQPNQRACLTPARTGLRCERQNAFPDAEIDVLAAADWLFPGGMDHHRLMTGSRLGNDLFVKLVRRMGGSGTLPERAVDERPAARDEDVELCVVGAGPAGLSAAGAFARARPGARVVVYDDQPEPGGSLLAEPEGSAQAAALVTAARAAGATIVTGAEAIGVYDDVLAVATPEGLRRVRARRFLYATGAYEQSLPIADNDRPSVLAARAAGRLAFRWGVVPGRRVFVLRAGGGAMAAYLERLGAGLRAAGVALQEVALEDAREQLPHDQKRDALVIGATPAPASELPRQHGATVELDATAGGFAVSADAGRAAPGVYVAGDVTGYVGPVAAARAGADVGAAMAAGFDEPARGG